MSNQQKTFRVTVHHGFNNYEKIYFSHYPGEEGGIEEKAIYLVRLKYSSRPTNQQPEKAGPYPSIVIDHVDGGSKRKVSRSTSIKTKWR